MKTAFAILPKYVAALALGCVSLAQAQTPAAPAQRLAPQSRIATFSAERIYGESKLVRHAEEKLAQEFKSREGALNELAARLHNANESYEKDKATLGESERVRRQKDNFELDKEFERRKREFGEDVTQRRNEERAIIADKAAGIIRQIATADGYDVVLQDPFWFNPRIDITDKVIAELDK